MRVVNVFERSYPLSRYLDPSIPSGGLTTSIVSVVTDVVRRGQPIVGYGFSSIGRFAQGGLIRERFGPRLLAADTAALESSDGETIDPRRAWSVMMRGEKPGGHGDRSVAVGTLDMALWDAAAKIAGQPLNVFLAGLLGREAPGRQVPVYASGGYRYPHDDLQRLKDEVHHFRDVGHRQVKMKIGAVALGQDLRRLDAALTIWPDPSHVAVDAMNQYSANEGLAAAKALRSYNLRWFEDVCDPLDFEAQSAIASAYGSPIAAGEALFSAAEAVLLHRYGGLLPKRDILLFDPVHCYGVPGYLQIIGSLETSGWPRSAFWPHGGHIFSLHLASALGLGGSEVNPSSFRPFGGLCDNEVVVDGLATVPSAEGIGFELKADLIQLFDALLGCSEARLPRSS